MHGATSQYATWTDWKRLQDKRLHALLLVTIFLVAALSQIPAAKAITNYTVTSHTMCKNVASNWVCQGETHAFDASDTRAYVFFVVKMGETGTITASSVWHYQSGSKEGGDDWGSSDVKAGESWYFREGISIKGDKASLRGFWTVDVSIEGKLAFTEKFTIGPYYEARVEMKGVPETVSIPVKIDGEGYGEIKGGEVKKLGFAPGTSHTLSIANKETPGDTGVRYLAQEDTWNFTGEGSHSFSFTEQDQLNIEVDPRDAATAFGTGWYNKTATVNLSIPETVAAGEGTQYARKAIIVDGQEVSTPPTSVTMDKPHLITVRYQKQYSLNLTSDYGEPEGEGWYDEGTEAKFSVTSPQPEPGILGLLGGKVVFQAWTGDSTAKSPAAKIKMDGPKTVRAVWTTDDTQAYIILGGIAAAIVVAIVAVLLLTRRKGRGPPAAAAPVGPIAPAPVPYAPVVTPQAPAIAPPPVARAPPPGMKFCVHCGQPIPQASKFCTNIKCGMPQQ
jgi:hypothetical protein